MKRNFLLLLLFVFSIACVGAAANRPKVIIDTNYGNYALGEIALELFPEQSPITVANFLQYVNSGFYNSLMFHRIIQGFMIQGGSYFHNDGIPFIPYTPGDPIINESYNGLSNLRGTIAMARTGDPNSATCQFFINHIDNLFLDRANAGDGFGYCVFGRVLSGMDVVDTIASVEVNDVNDYYGNLLENYPDPTPVYIYHAFVAGPGYWLQADLDNSGVVNGQDFAILAEDWGQTAAGQAGDMDGSGTVDMADLELFAKGWMQTTQWYWATKVDLNNDSAVNIRDLALFASVWLETGEGTPGDYDGNGTVNMVDYAGLTNSLGWSAN